MWRLGIGFLVFLATGTIGVVWSAPAPNFGAYHAIVIGNNAYTDLPKLKTAANDARGIASLLQTDYGFNVRLMIDATREDIIGALAEVRAELGPNDNLLIYFAGHGVLDSYAEEGYWLPVNAGKKNPANWISNDDITNMVKAIPSEAEWEYAARGATATVRYWGDRRQGACSHANVHDMTSKSTNSSINWPHFKCEDGHARTAPVGSFRANGFGLYDMLGNAEEWTRDCWNEKYLGAPDGGSAWTSGNCRVRVTRGGSWKSHPRNVRSATRAFTGTRLLVEYVGFRVARDLD